MKSNEKIEFKNQVIVLLDSFIAEILIETKKISFNKNIDQQLLLICLYGRIIELSATALKLIKVNDQVGLPMIIRSQLEAFVDFMNLINDSGYVNIMTSEFAHQRKKFLKNFKNINNFEEPKSETDKYCEELLKSHKHTQIFQKFSNISLDKTYLTVYFILCGYSHNNLAMLEHRHIENKCGDLSVVFFKDEPFDIYVRFLMTLGAIIVDSYKNMFSFFNKYPVKNIEILCDQFKNIRESAVKFYTDDP